jgi:hypothetical protein
MWERQLDVVGAPFECFGGCWTSPELERSSAKIELVVGCESLKIRLFPFCHIMRSNFTSRIV